MLAPFVLPERLGRAVVADPVFLHVAQRARSTTILEDLRDVGVFAGAIAVGIVGTIAVIGPSLYISLSSNVRKHEEA